MTAPGSSVSTVPTPSYTSRFSTAIGGGPSPSYGGASASNYGGYGTSSGTGGYKRYGVGGDSSNLGQMNVISQHLQ